MPSARGVTKGNADDEQDLTLAKLIIQVEELKAD